MPITKITIENFKGIGGRTEVELKPVTVLFGANSAGKSTLLQALLYLRELLERRNADADRLQAGGASIDLGGFRRFVHGHDLQREVRIGVTVAVGPDGLPVPTVAQLFSAASEGIRDFAENGISNVREVGVTITVGWNRPAESPEIRYLEVNWDGTPFAKLKAESEKQCYLDECNADHPSLMAAFQTEVDQGEPPQECLDLFEYLQGHNTTEASTGSLRVPINMESVIPENRQLILREPGGGLVWELREGEGDYEAFLACARSQMIVSQLISGTKELVLDELRKIRYIGPLRTVPERGFTSLRSPREDRWSDGLAAWDQLYDSASMPDGGGLVGAVSEWLCDRLRLGYSLVSRKYFEVEQDGLAHLALEQLAESALDEDIEDRIKQILADIEESPVRATLSLYDETSETDVAPCDIGVGVSQVIPVVVGSVLHGERTVVIEQPELHLHPAVQARLGDLFIGSALEDAGLRFILESHSEHLMLRLLRRIRESAEGDSEYPDYLPPVAPEDVSVYYVQAGERKTEMIRLRISKEGDFLDRWPNGFFDERAEELF